MDANNQAAFKSVAEEKQEKICPACSAKNDIGAKFCFSCGNNMMEDKQETQAPAFTAVQAAVTIESYKEPESVFASGLPSWSLEPPQVVVRRRVSK